MVVGRWFMRANVTSIIKVNYTRAINLPQYM